MSNSEIVVCLWRAETEAQALSLQSWLEGSGMAAAEVVPYRQRFMIGALVNASTSEQLQSLLPPEPGREPLELPTSGDEEFLAEATNLRQGFVQVAQLLEAGYHPSVSCEEGNLRIWVQKAEATVAREQLPTQGPSSPLVEIDFSQTSHEVAKEGPQVPRESLVAWPLCPQCGKGRTAGCPFCGAAGTEFPRADQAFAEELEADELFVLCPQCDEPIIARFYRRCEWCGHDFETGLTLPPERRYFLGQRATERLNLRAWLTIGGLLGLGLFFFVYFSWVSQ